MTHRKLVTSFVLVFAVLACVPLTLAQPLADRIPADAIVYVGWSGSDDMGPGYAQSHLKAMLDAAEVRRILDDVLPKLIARVGEQQPQAGDVGKVAGDILAPMWHHPTALYIGPVDLTNPKKPVPSLALICNAGDAAPAMERQLEQLLQMAGPKPVEASVRSVGGTVVFSVGNAKPIDDMFVKGAKVRSLQQVDAFSSAMAMQKSPAIAAYIDAEAAIKFLDEAVDKGDDRKAKDEWPKLRDALNLRGLKRISFTQGIDGKDWGTQVFIEAPAPRTGLFAGFDAEPIGDDMLRAIPSTATMAGVARFDLGGMFDGLRDTVRKLDPKQAEKMDKDFAQANEMLGLDIRKDVLAALGDQWAYFLAPELTGRGPLGIVLVNRLKDAGKAQLTSDKLKELANEVIKNQNTDPNVHVAFKQAKVGDVTVHYLATPFATPSWAIQNGNLYVGLYPQVVSEAAGHVSREGKSILDHAGFAALRTRLGGGRAVSIQFYDLPKSAPTAYQVWMLASSMGKFGDVLGVDTPLMLLPPLSKLTEHLAVAGSASWVDDKGWHFHAVTPFPGATTIASETAGLLDVQSSTLLAGVLLPALNKSRDSAQRVASMNHLRQLGLAVQLYANERDGKFPDDIAELAKTADVTADAYLNPRKGKQAPPNLKDDELGRWAKESSDYVYVGKGKTIRSAGDTIIFYEKPDGLTDGVCFAYADGHVDFKPMPQARQAIEKAEKP